MTKRECPREILERLAKAADHFMTMSHLRGSLSQEAMDADIALGDCVKAYRSATAPLRTREQVDAERLRNLDSWKAEAMGSSMLRVKDDRLCREPTSGPSGEAETNAQDPDPRQPLCIIQRCPNCSCAACQRWRMIQALNQQGALP
jgi:molybdenum cofactor biosynthesis enzyme MoaA